MQQHHRFHGLGHGHRFFWGATIQPTIGGMYKKHFSLHERETMGKSSERMSSIPTSYSINFFFLINFTGLNI